jgi:hypothetical protein
MRDVDNEVKCYIINSSTQFSESYAVQVTFPFSARHISACSHVCGRQYLEIETPNSNIRSCTHSTKSFGRVALSGHPTLNLVVVPVLRRAASPLPH